MAVVLLLAPSDLTTGVGVGVDNLAFLQFILIILADFLAFFELFLVILADFLVFLELFCCSPVMLSSVDWPPWSIPSS